MNTFQKTVQQAAKIIVTILSLSASTLVGAPDCMDTSSHLGEKIDYKELRYVQCNHNCYKDPDARLVENRGKCSVCGHYHMPRPLVLVETANPAALPTPKKPTKRKAQNQLARLFAIKHTK